MRQEKERVELALKEAQTKAVSLICSGDPQLYGMAGLVIETILNLPEEKLFVTVYKDDDEAFEIWQKNIDAEKIFKMDKEDSFWEIGEGLFTF